MLQSSIDCEASVSGSGTTFLPPSLTFLLLGASPDALPLAPSSAIALYAAAFGRVNVRHIGASSTPLGHEELDLTVSDAPVHAFSGCSAMPESERTGADDGDHSVHTYIWQLACRTRQKRSRRKRA